MVRFSVLFSVNRLLAFFTGRAKHNVEREGMPTSGDGMVSAPLSPPPVHAAPPPLLCPRGAGGPRRAPAPRVAGSAALLVAATECAGRAALPRAGPAARPPRASL